MKKAFGVIGLGIVIGVTIYGIVKKNKKEKNKLNKSSKKICNRQSGNRDNLEEEPNFIEDIKTSSVEKIYTRHREAANIMEEAIKNIYNESKEADETNEDFDELSNELDKLLSEE